MKINDLLTLPTAHDGELWRLLAALCDGLLSPPQRDRLEAILTADATARRFCAAYLDQHAQMLWLYRDAPDAGSGDAPHDGPTMPTGGPLDGPPVPTEFDPTPETARSPLLGFLNVSWQSINSSSRTLALALGGLLVGYFVVVIALIPMARRMATAESKRPLAPSGQPGQTEMVGKLLASPNARWDRQRSPSAGGGVLVGQRYELASGWAKIELTRGTALAIQGPAVWRIEAEGRLQLELGRLLAHVPPAAIGFTVATPAGEVVDLGTEFGVVVDRGRTEVHVIRGKVEVKPSCAGRGAADGSIQLAAGSIQLAAGRAVRMENRGPGVSPIVLDRAGFAAVLQNSNAKGTAGSFPAVDWTGIPTEAGTFQDGVGGYSGTQDTFVHGAMPDNNYGTEMNIGVYERETATTNYARGLIRFDLSSVAPGTLVAGATLTLCQRAAVGAAGVSNSLHVIAAPDKDWTETGATWNSSHGGTAWTGGPGLVAGDDYDPISVATAETPIAAGAPMTFALSAAGVAAIQHWVNHPADNSGFLLRQPDSSNSIDLFWSREATEVSLRPALTLTLIAP